MLLLFLALYTRNPWQP